MDFLTHRKSLRFTLLSLMAALMLLVSAGAAKADQLQLDEQKIEAGLVYNILKYTKWPPASGTARNQRLDICLFGNGPLNNYLMPIQGRTAQQYTIHIVRKNAQDALSSCSLAFIHDDQEDNLPALLKLLAGRNILTVSDINHFSTRGGMIELSTRQDSRIHLYINRQAVEAAGLEVEDRLMNLAEKVD